MNNLYRLSEVQIERLKPIVEHQCGGLLSHPPHSRGQRKATGR